MKKFVLFAILFTCLSFTLITLYKYKASQTLMKRFGPNLEQQIDSSFARAIHRNYEILIMGNSRIYRGINPDFLAQPSYNFSNDNDSYNVIYHKLNYLNQKNVHYSKLILGIDYFLFSYLDSKRNYAYSKYLGSDFLKDYSSNLNSTIPENRVSFFFDEMENFRGINKTEIIAESWKMERKDPNLNETGGFIYKSNGHLLDTWHTASKSDFVKRKTNRLKIQVKYFRMIIAKCKKEKIKLYIVMPPVRKEEMKNYSTTFLSDFNSFVYNLINKDTNYFNYSENILFKMDDFSDITHLNGEGSEKFTKLLDKEIL